jgi:endonuclease/exonuclease/phosphatase family metal-dependent hydrolase
VKIVNWNCNMSFARKRELVMALQPDLLILQEVSRRDIDDLPADFKHWIGNNPHKGLAIVAFGDHEYTIADCGTGELPWFIPLRIADLDLHIIAVWACVKTPQFRYVRVIHAALDCFESFIRAAPTIMAGDFNSNTIWDNKHGALDHTHMTARLESLGLRSLYHVLNTENHGEEITPTWYMYRNRTKGYHIDYFYVPEPFNPTASLAIGHPDAWLPQSDHMPLTLDLATTHGPQ